MENHRTKPDKAHGMAEGNFMFVFGECVGSNVNRRMKLEKVR